MLVEVQALCNNSVTENPRRLTVGYDSNRLAMSIAVLARHGGVMLSDMDIFVNCVGGIKIEETSADLAVLLAIFFQVLKMRLFRRMSWCSVKSV